MRQGGQGRKRQTGWARRATLLLGLAMVFALGLLATGALGDTGTGTGTSTDTTAAATTDTTASTTDTTAATTTDPGATSTAADTTTTATTATDTTSTDTTTTATGATPSPSAASLSADKANYIAGDMVVLTGTGFTAGETVAVHVSDTGASAWIYNGSATAASDGSFTASFQLPKLFASTFSATTTGAPGETASLNITDAFNASSFTPAIKSDQSDYAPGSTVTISGSGWPAQDALTVFINDTVGNTWNLTGTATTDATGEFTYTFTLPNWFVASYTTTANDGNGMSAATSFTDATNTSTTIASSVNPSSLNQSVTFTAVVTCSLASCTFDSAKHSLSFVDWGISTPNPNCNGGTVLWTQPAITESVKSETFVYSTTSLSTGTHDITACLTGGGSGLNPGSSNSAAVAQVVQGRQNQSITVTTHAPGSAGYNSQFGVAATASSGLAVAITTTGGCSGSGSGSATVTMTSGSTSCVVHYNQAGNGNYNAAAEATETTTATLAAQSITVTTHAPGSAGYNSQFGVAATASSGLAVAITTTGGCSGSGSGSATVTMTSGSTSCVVHYNQAGNGNYNAAAEATETTTATPAPSTVTVSCPKTDQTYTGSVQTPCTAVATGVGLGAGVDLTGSIVYDHNLNVGTANASATWAGDDNHTGNSGADTFSIVKATLTVTPDAQARTYGDPVGSYTFAVAGFKNLETKSTASGYSDPSCTSGYGPTTPVSASPTISCSGGTADNYKFDEAATANVTISKAPLTVTPNSQAITLGQADPAFTFTLAGFKNGESQSVIGDAAGESAPTCGTVSPGPHGVGTYTISCSGGLDNNYKFDTSATAALTVNYGLCLLYDSTKSFKAGSTAPLKLYLCNLVTGADVSSSAIVVNATSLKKLDNSADAAVTDTGNSSPDNNFRYDSTIGPSGGYIFNLSTKSPSPALGQGTTALSTGTWVLSLTIGGTSAYSVHFDVK